MEIRNIILYCSVAAVLSCNTVLADGFSVGVDAGCAFHDVSFDGNSSLALATRNAPFNNGKSANVTKASAAAQVRCGYYWGSDVRFAVDAIAEWMPLSKKVNYIKIDATGSKVAQFVAKCSQLEFKNGFGGGLGIKVSKDFGIHRIGLGVDVTANNYSLTESYGYLQKNDATADEKDVEIKAHKSSKTLIFVSPNISYEYAVAKNCGITLGYAYRFGSKLSDQYKKKAVVNENDRVCNVSVRPTAHVVTVGVRYYIPSCR